MRPNAADTPCDPVPDAGPTRIDEPIWAPAIARFTVRGLRCRHCEVRIRNALTQCPRVLGADVDIERGRVDVLFDTSTLNPDSLARMIADAARGSPRVYEVTHVTVV